MIIVTYHTDNPEVPEKRRWLAQIEKIKNSFYVTFHGATEEEARAKAQEFWDAIPKKDQPAEEVPVEVVKPKIRHIEDLL